MLHQAARLEKQLQDQAVGLAGKLDAVGKQEAKDRGLNKIENLVF
jgi:hypothetical protein